MDLIFAFHKEYLINILQDKVSEETCQEISAEVTEIADCLRCLFDSILNLLPGFFNENNLHMTPDEYLRKIQEMNEDIVALLDARIAELSDDQ